MVVLDFLTMTQHDKSLHGILQLPDIARPWVVWHAGHGIITDIQRFIGAETLQKMPDQQRNIFRSLAQRGQINRDNRQAIIQVVTKASFLDGIFNIPIGCSNDPDINGTDFAANRLHLHFLQHPQKLRLQLHRHLTDFIEEQSATIGIDKLTITIANGPCEGSLNVTKQFTFQKVGWNGRTVDSHKGMFATRSTLVNSFCNQFFAGTTFACNQDTRLGRRNPPDKIENLLHAIRTANHVTEIDLMLEFAFEALVFFL